MDSLPVAGGRERGQERERERETERNRKRGREREEEALRGGGERREGWRLSAGPIPHWLHLKIFTSPVSLFGLLFLSLSLVLP